MKKKLLPCLLLAFALIFSAFGLIACDSDSQNNATDKEIYAIYTTYVAYAEGKGDTALSYEEWLISIKGENGLNGENGKSAYEIWLSNGYTGTQGDFLNWLKGEKGTDGINGVDGKDGTNGEDGKSAYEIWLDNGNTGTQADFLTWLKGQDGTNGTDGINGVDGKDGTNGENGKSAYEIWLDNGNTGTEEDFLNWLKGEKGTDGINGTNGIDGKDGINGVDGKDGTDGTNGTDGVTPRLRINPSTNMWEVSYDDGETYTSLNVKATGEKGADGKDGINGVDGKDVTNGTNGTDGINGVDGKDGTNGENGKSAYEIWLDNGNTGTEEDFLNWLKGEKGADGKDGINGVDGKDGTNGIDGKDGKDGKDGANGKSAYEIWLDSGYTGTEEDFLNWIKGDKENPLELDLYPLPDGTYSVAVGNARCLKEIVIPSTYNNKPVTRIDKNGFLIDHYELPLESVIIPDSVTSIGDSAFFQCSSLTSVTIGDSVTSIGGYAFSGCSSLTNINVSENNACYKSIDGNLYSKDGKTLIQYAIGKTATEFIIPDSVTSIGCEAFAGCSSLQSVTIGNSVTSIENYAFPDCSSLSKVYYKSSETEWNAISFNSGNSYLEYATIYYYSATTPSAAGNYWHYDTDGKTPIAW